MQYDVGPAMLAFDTIARPCVQVARKGLVDAVTTENYQYSPGMVRLRGVWSTLQKKSIAEAGAHSNLSNFLIVQYCSQEKPEESTGNGCPRPAKKVKVNLTKRIELETFFESTFNGAVFGTDRVAPSNRLLEVCLETGGGDRLGEWIPWKKRTCREQEIRDDLAKKRKEERRKEDGKKRRREDSDSEDDEVRGCAGISTCSDLGLPQGCCLSGRAVQRRPVEGRVRVQAAREGASQHAGVSPEGGDGLLRRPVRCSHGGPAVGGLQVGGPCHVV